MKITPVEKGNSPMSRVLHVQIPEKYDLAMTFVRMQEWYESPKFHHKHFTLEQFMRWYSKAYGKGAFTYPKDWCGFNVPSTAVTAIMNGPSPHPNYAWSDRWSKVETTLFMALMNRGLIKEPDPTTMAVDWTSYCAPQPFYLIGTMGAFADGGGTLEHEKVHGRFFVYPEYRREVIRTVRNYNTKPLAQWLLKKGYSKWTLEDEIHAYTLTGWPQGFAPTAPLKSLRRDLLSIVGR